MRRTVFVVLVSILLVVSGVAPYAGPVPRGGAVLAGPPGSSGQVAAGSLGATPAGSSHPTPAGSSHPTPGGSSSPTPAGSFSPTPGGSTTVLPVPSAGATTLVPVWVPAGWYWNGFTWVFVQGHWAWFQR
jgi:hypothetical protein